MHIKIIACSRSSFKPIKEKSSTLFLWDSPHFSDQVVKLIQKAKGPTQLSCGYIAVPTALWSKNGDQNWWVYNLIKRKRFIRATISLHSLRLRFLDCSASLHRILEVFQNVFWGISKGILLDLIYLSILCRTKTLLCFTIDLKYIALWNNLVT